MTLRAAAPQSRDYECSWPEDSYRMAIRPAQTLVEGVVKALPLDGGGLGGGDTASSQRSLRARLRGLTTPRCSKSVESGSPGLVGSGFALLPMVPTLRVGRHQSR